LVRRLEWRLVCRPRYDSRKADKAIRYHVKTFGLAALLFLTGCGQAPMPLKAVWTGALELPETKVALRMDLDLSSDPPGGTFLVGKERTPIPEITRNGNTLTLTFSEYGAEMRAEWDGHQLKGEYLRRRESGTKSFPFSASPETNAATNRNTPGSPLGTFQVAFKDAKEGDGVTMAKFWKEGDSYYGTFIAPDGDYGLLEHASDSQSLLLHRLTGWQAITIELHTDGSGWSGRFHAASNDAPRAFSLQPHSGGEATPPSEKLVRMKNPDAPFAFSCASLSGEPVSNTDARFKGKALAVDIMGTWCHNCMDESPVLEELRTRYAKDGFEVIGLSFEISDDADLGRKNLALFRDRFKLTYPLLFCGSVDDANLDKHIKNQLPNFFAFPTTLFIDRKGKVQAVHSGFRGPGTGDQYPLQIQKLHELAAQAIR
jgi:thiol-disulfide isomerase/thioredoxin